MEQTTQQPGSGLAAGIKVVFPSWDGEKFSTGVFSTGALIGGTLLLHEDGTTVVTSRPLPVAVVSGSMVVRYLDDEDVAQTVKDTRRLPVSVRGTTEYRFSGAHGGGSYDPIDFTMGNIAAARHAGLKTIRGIYWNGFDVTLKLAIRETIENSYYDREVDVPTETGVVLEFSLAVDAIQIAISPSSPIPTAGLARFAAIAN